jgi:pantoate kinase
LRNRCVLDGKRKATFHWGKLGDVSKVAEKFIKDENAIADRCVAIKAIVDNMTKEELNEQLVILNVDTEHIYEDLNEMKRKVLSTLNVDMNEKNPLVRKFVHWSRNGFEVLGGFYEDAIILKDAAFTKQGHGTFQKVISRVISSSGDKYYSDNSKHFEKWIGANHFQMLRKPDLEFFISSARILARKTDSMRELLKDAIDVLESIMKVNKSVADYDESGMLWVIRADTPLTAGHNHSKRPCVTPEKSATKRAKESDEAVIGRMLLSDNIDREGTYDVTRIVQCSGKEPGVTDLEALLKPSEEKQTSIAVLTEEKGKKRKIMSA